MHTINGNMQILGDLENLHEAEREILGDDSSNSSESIDDMMDSEDEYDSDAEENPRCIYIFRV